MQQILKKWCQFCCLLSLCFLYKVVATAHKWSRTGTVALSSNLGSSVVLTIKCHKHEKVALINIRQVCAVKQVCIMDKIKIKEQKVLHTMSYLKFIHIFQHCSIVVILELWVLKFFSVVCGLCWHLGLLCKMLNFNFLENEVLSSMNFIVLWCKSTWTWTRQNPITILNHDTICVDNSSWSTSLKHPGSSCI